jgi:hypothetical protein
VKFPSSELGQIVGVLLLALVVVGDAEPGRDVAVELANGANMLIVCGKSVGRLTPVAAAPVERATIILVYRRTSDQQTYPRW